MASLTAHAPHSGPVDQPGEGAYLWARSGIARSATTRSNYVSIATSIDWIVRDNAGNITGTTDISGIILHDSLRVTLALNDEPDTCSFTLRPQEPPAAIPQVGQEIRIAWAPGGPPLFHGYIVTSQSDWRLKNMQPPWIAIQCQDPMWRFDARIVTYRFPAQSVTDSIAFLVKYFCNLSPTTVSALDFTLGSVQAGMPSIPAFDVVNQRPSTVMRTLLSAVNGGFYIEGFVVHAWANSVSEPLQTNPQPLAVGLKTLHAFRRTEDATQVRRRVLVEGRRTATLISWPTMGPNQSRPIGLPLQDASLFNLSAGPEVRQLTRIGTQWAYMEFPVSLAAAGKNTPQTQTALAFDPATEIRLTLKPMPIVPPIHGWIRVGNQYSRYSSSSGNPLTGNWTVDIAVPANFPYGYFTVPIPAGSTVEWVDSLEAFHAHGLWWDHDDQPQTGSGDDLIRAQPTDTPVVTLAMAQTALDRWPPLEGFVQDGRYSYTGVQARDDADLAAFKDPLLSVEWKTDDLNAIPGRSQVIAMSSAAVTPAINTTVTILRVELTFPLRTLPPRRHCTGGMVKPSTFMDLVVTENS